MKGTADSPTPERPIPVSPARSRIMKAIRSKGNKSTELRLARVLRAAALTGWRRHPDLRGTPDFAWRKTRVALFVDGCFWHGCPRCYRVPRHNTEFWSRKVQGNRRRDRIVTRTLRSQGWSVIRVWECRIDARSTITRIARLLATNQNRGK